MFHTGPPIGMFSLFRLPLVAFRPHDLLLVFEVDRRVAGLVRVERENWRDDWTFVELDAIGSRDSGEIRYRLVQHVLREGQMRHPVERPVMGDAAIDAIRELMMKRAMQVGHAAQKLHFVLL